ncbi:pyruvate dehydrogenase complex dihydrolipoamide acetyltransferase [Maricaulis virginensis]|uniref:Acetyltransferase component of pyruvate dehydrogenase complex n=1 Tax=Maricaulis virginensis TaxID=144022 RepID=A0A9W6MNU9_9PROT|nr:pyruvate dehydrogenase complex dihydrolipoamide acetyltransferase [Maricaulis virginensis]GLK52316.1 acetyltransferase component of pyruvate dehydrogenase complex [Maricaulis virginensis]
MSIEILMPALSPTMEEGTLAKWHVKKGDTVESGDVIAEIETDKATMEVEAVDEGVVGEIRVSEGTEGVKVNAVIAILLEEGEDESALSAPAEGGGSGSAKGGDEGGAGEASEKAETKSEAKSQTSSGSASTRKLEDVPAESKAPPPPSRDGDRIKASPLARRIAADKGLDLKTIEGSGPYGRIVKRDVEKAQPSAAPSKAAEAPAAAPVDMDDPLKAYGIARDRYEVEKADNITKISAKRLSESFRDIPHFPLNVDCRIDALLDFRKRVNAAAEKDGDKVSVNDILIKASGLALKKVPAANSSWIEGGHIARHKHADVSVAVAIEGGLITPIVKDADQKGLVEISREMKDLAARAREKKLKPEEFQGGTFSLSNLGMFGIDSFASIINPPQGMILSVGAGEERPVVKDGALAIATVMTVTLTCDHRVVDGATGAKWLQAFKTFVEDPMTMLM